MRQLKILTFNIAHGRGRSLYQGFASKVQLQHNLSEIARLIACTGADIVALQEVDTASRWNKYINMLDQIAGETGLRNSVMGVNTFRPGRFQLEYGNALLTRFHVNHWENQPFGQKMLGEKGFLFCELRLDDGQILPLINLHLHPTSRRRRLQQTDQLIKFLHQRCLDHGPFQLDPIVCGDFNTGRRNLNDATIHLWRHLSAEASYSLLPTRARTFPASWPHRTLDFVFIPPIFRITSEEVIKSRLSDHRPVLVCCTLDDAERAD